MAGYPEVGDRAPDFTLPRNRDETMTLSTVLQARKAVLIFYVLDFTAP